MFPVATLAEMEIENGVSVKMRGPIETTRSGKQMLGVGLVAAKLLVYLVLHRPKTAWLAPAICQRQVSGKWDWPEFRSYYLQSKELWRIPRSH
jgi:hypothetical protein